MMELEVHTQKLMSGRIDVKCPNCASRLAHYTSVTYVGHVKKCHNCDYALANALKLFKDKEFKYLWHFYKIESLA